MASAYYYICTYQKGWLGGVVVSVLDSWLRSRRFDSRPVHCQAITLGKLLTPMCLCLQEQYNLVLAKGRWCSVTGKVTIGLASHWPCGTDFNGLSTYRLTATEREMSTPPMLQTGAWSTLSYIRSHVQLLICSWCCTCIISDCRVTEAVVCNAVCLVHMMLFMRQLWSN